MRVGSLAGPLRSLECVASGKLKGVRTANDRMEVQAQRQPSILTKGRRMPRWHVQRGRRQAIIGAVRRIHAVAESLRQVANSAQTVEVKVGPRALKVSTPLWGGIRVRYPRRPTKTYGTPFDAPSDGGRDGVAREFLAAR